MTQLYSNDASAQLAVQLEVGDTLLVVDTGFGQLFPQPVAAEDFFTLTLENVSGEMEICTCTSRATDTMVIVRAQQGTSEFVFPIQSRIEVRLTAADMAQFVQKDAPVLQADLDLGGNAIINGEIVGVPIRGDSNNTSNEIVVPAAGPPTIGGDEILTAANNPVPAGGIMLWSGNIGNIPADWALCDGNNGTPDLSARFIVGYGAGDPDFGTVGAIGGDNTGVTSDTAAIVDPTIITEAMMPAHNHTILKEHLPEQQGPDASQFYQAQTGTVPIANTFATMIHPETVDKSTEDKGGGAAHAHNSPVHNHTTTLPAYMVLAYIMKL